MFFFVLRIFVIMIMFFLFTSARLPASTAVTKQKLKKKYSSTQPTMNKPNQKVYFKNKISFPPPQNQSIKCKLIETKMDKSLNDWNFSWKKKPKQDKFQFISWKVFLVQTDWLTDWLTANNIFFQYKSKYLFFFFYQKSFKY